MTQFTPTADSLPTPPPKKSSPAELLEVKAPKAPSQSVEKPEKAGIVDPTMERPSQNEKAEGLLASAEKHLYPNYAQPRLVMDHGKGSLLWDTSGKRYIDFFGGIAVSTLGHAHPQLTKTIREQAEKLIHLSNYFYTEPNIRLAGSLCELAGMDRAFFCNSGTEANEAALKLARRHFFDRGQERRDFVVAFDGSFHGRTLGSLTATGQTKYRTGFGPIGGVLHAPFGDLDAARALVTDRVAAIIVEPVLGEGGVIPAPEGFLLGLRELCDETGTLLILDEIQTGVGRTGAFLACEHAGVRADIVTLAKGLGGGVPIGAMLTTEALRASLPPGSHGTTFGGNPLASAAALCVLQVLHEEGLVERTRILGDVFETELKKLAETHVCVSNQRGKGLLQALVVNDPSKGPLILEALRNAGLLITFAGGTVLRFTPPLTISESELNEGLTILDQVLGDFS